MIEDFKPKSDTPFPFPVDVEKQWLIERNGVRMWGGFRSDCMRFAIRLAIRLEEAGNSSAILRILPQDTVEGIVRRPPVDLGWHWAQHFACIDVRSRLVLDPMLAHPANETDYPNLGFANSVTVSQFIAPADIAKYGRRYPMGEAAFRWWENFVTSRTMDRTD